MADIAADLLTANNGKALPQGVNEAGTGFVALKVNASGALHTSLQEIEDAMEIEMEGDIAHDAADGTSMPVKIGGKAVAAEPAAVSAADRVNASFDLYGNQRIVGNILHDTADRGEPMKIGFKAADPASMPADVSADDRTNGVSDLKGRQIITMDEVIATPDAAAPARGITVSATANAAQQTPDEGDSSPLSTNLFGELRVMNESAEGTHDSAKPARGIVVQAACQATADSPDDGDAADLSVTTGNELRVIQETVTGASDAAAPTNSLQVAGIANAAAPTPDEGDLGTLSMDLSSNLRVIAAANTGVDIGDVDVTSTPFDATTGAAVPAVGAFIAGSDGTNARAIKTSATGDVFVMGEIAHDTADTGNPIKLGGKAASSAPGGVTAGDRVNAYFDLNGRQVIYNDLTQAVPDAAAPAQAHQVGAVANATAATPDEGDLGALSMDLSSNLRVKMGLAEAAHDAAVPANVVLAGAVANATADTPDEGDASRLSVTLGSELRVINESASAAADAAAPARVQFVGGRGNAAAPTADDEGDIISLSVDLQGSQRMIGNIAHDAADAGEPIKQGGKASTTRPAAVSNADRVNAYFDEYGRQIGMLDGKAIVLHASAAETASATETAVTYLDGFSIAEILFDVTAAATDGADTLDLYIDCSPDGGTTWLNTVHFTQVLGNGGVKQFFATLNVAGATGTAIVAAGSDLTTAPDIRHFIGNAMRARYVIVDSGDANQSFTFSVSAVLKN